MLVEIIGGLAVFLVVKVTWSSLTFNTSNKLRHHADKNGGKPPKPLSSMPGPRGLPFIGTLLDVVFFNPVEGKLHTWLERRYKEYGPIFVEKILAFKMVVLYNPEHIDQLIRMDGKYPNLFMIEPWRQWKEDHGQPNGFITSVNKEWKKLRTAWNKVILNSTEVYSYLDELNDVQSDAIQLLNTRKGKDGRHPALDKFLFSWALENIGVFLFEKRIGCLADKSNEEAQKFIEAVVDVFGTSEALSLFPNWLNKIFLRGYLKKHDAAWTLISKTAREVVDNKLKSMTKDLDEGIPPSGFLASIIARHDLAPEEIFSCVTELMAAAVDTTSNTSHFALYELARNPEVQTKLYEEIVQVTNGQTPTAEHLSRMTYLKATLREVQRMYPVAMGASRVPSEDVVIGGYLIPAKTNIFADTWVNGRFEKNFPDPEEFRPERWFETDTKLSVQTSASVPFGIGSRGCIGRKVAETEMMLLIIHILLKFELRFGGREPMTLATRAVLVPKRPIDILFINRE